MVMRKSRSFTSTSLARGEVVGALAEQAAERNTAKRRTRGRPRCKPSCRIPPTSAKKGFYVRARGFMDERSRADVRDRGVVRGCYARVPGLLRSAFEWRCATRSSPSCAPITSPCQVGPLYALAWSPAGPAETRGTSRKQHLAAPLRHRRQSHAL